MVDVRQWPAKVVRNLKEKMMVSAERGVGKSHEISCDSPGQLPEGGR